jgi:hypothetical protein
METIALPIPLPGAPPFVPHEIRAAPPARRAKHPTKIPKFRTNLNLLCTGGPFLLLTFQYFFSAQWEPGGRETGGSRGASFIRPPPVKKVVQKFF